MQVPMTKTQKNPAEKIVNFAQQHKLTDHPFFQRVTAEEPNLTALWAFYNNLKQVTDKVPGWLANIIMHVKDAELQCFLAGIMHDELGSGKPERVHSRLMIGMLDALDPWSVKENKSLNPSYPGKELANEMANFFAGDTINTYWAVGSLISGEVYAEQMIFLLADEIRRQDKVDIQAFQWQLEHEAVESDHAGASESMSRIVPTSGVDLENTIKGANWKRDTLIKWLDGIYYVTYKEKVGYKS